MTPDEALAIYRAGPETVVRVLLEMDERVNAGEQRVRHLEERLAKDSHNSSKPPSSDGLGKPKPKPKSLRQRSGRPTGGQPGHAGQTLRMVEKPDSIVSHPAKRCTSCGSSLTEQKPDRIERRQVFDLPEPKLEVTEHRAEIKTCACGCVNRAAFPPDITAPVQYGLRVKSVAVYLKEYQLLPFERLAEIMRDIFACSTFSEGSGARVESTSLSNFSADCSQRLEPIDEIIRAQVTAAEVAGFDETGMRATGSLHWLHTVSTRWLTWYFAHAKRGREAMDAGGVLQNFKGRAVHDFWGPYLNYLCDHAFCNSHLLRELIFLWEQQEQAWANSMIDHLLAIKKAVDTAREVGQSALPTADIEGFLAGYLKIVETGYEQNPDPDPPDGPKRRGRRKQSKGRNLLDRFREHQEGILAFMRDFSVPFDNNLPERDLRMMKLRQKISGTFRSITAVVDFCRIRGYVSTARKNGLNALDALRRVFQGDPFVPAVNAE